MKRWTLMITSVLGLMVLGWLAAGPAFSQGRARVSGLARIHPISVR
jgi:hypothetical protein